MASAVAVEVMIAMGISVLNPSRTRVTHYNLLRCDDRGGRIKLRHHDMEDMTGGHFSVGEFILRRDAFLQCPSDYLVAAFDPSIKGSCSSFL